MNSIGMEKYDAISWCIKNGIKVYAVPMNAKNYFVEVDNNGNITRSPKTYNKKEWSDKVYDIYLYYYKKYSK
jgi:hypothetical protein